MIYLLLRFDIPFSVADMEFETAPEVDLHVFVMLFALLRQK